MSDLILYSSDDGQTRLQLRVEGKTIWLTQLEIADLFQTTKQNISLHAINIFEEGELTSEATVKESLTVQTKGKKRGKTDNYLLQPRPDPGHRLPGTLAPWHSISPMGNDPLARVSGQGFRHGRRAAQRPSRLGPL
jgi:hypothetical protein